MNQRTLILTYLIASIVVLSSCSEGKKAKDLGNGFKQEKNHHSMYSVDSEYPILSKEASDLNDQALEKINNSKFDKALKLFEQANEIEPDNPAILSNIGNIYKRLRAYERAEEFLTKSIEVSDSKYLPAIVNMSSLFMDMREYEKSIKLSESLLGKFENPEYQAGLFFNLIGAHSKFGNCKKAKIYIKELEIVAEATGQAFLVEKSWKYLLECTPKK